MRASAGVEPLACLCRPITTPLINGRSTARSTAPDYGGHAGLVEIREHVAGDRDRPARAGTISSTRFPSPRAPPRPKLFDNLRKFEMMGFGTRGDGDRRCACGGEDSLFDVITHLPREARERFCGLPSASGGAPKTASRRCRPVRSSGDAQRHFRVLTNMEELQRALDYPWEKWRCSCTPRSANWWSGTMLARRASLVRRRPARRSSRCTGRPPRTPSIRRRRCC